MSPLESRLLFLLKLFRGHEMLKNFSKFLQFLDSTLVCVSEAMRIEQNPSEMEKPSIRVSEIKRRGIREVRILLEMAKIGVLHEGFAPEEVDSKRDMSRLGTTKN